MHETSVLCFPRFFRILIVSLFLGLVAVAPLCASDDWKYEETRRDARDFVAGGFVHVRLSVGDLHIKRGSTNQVRVEYTVKSRHEKNVKESGMEFDVHGSDARIEFHAPMGGNTEFDVEVEVPQNTSIDVHNKVGDVTIDNIQGDKDLTLGVGDIRIADGHAGYRVIQVSAGIGDVHSDGYGEASGWLGKTLKYHGDGKYELRAHVGVGDIHLDGD